MVCVVQPDYLANRTAVEYLAARSAGSYASGNSINLFRAGLPDLPLSR
jgi:hypothetical protein